MQKSNHVIKREDVSAAPGPESSDTASLATALRNRIAAHRVETRADEGDDPPRSRPDKAHHVLRREETQRAIRPFPVPTAELDPDFPLPDDQAANLHENGKTASSSPSASGNAPSDPKEEALRAELEAEWQQRLDEAVKTAREEGYDQGRAEGYDAGYAEAQAELQKKFEAQKEELHKDVARLRDVWDQYLKESQPYLVQVTVDIAEMLLDAPLPESVQNASARAIAEAIEELASDPPLTILLHPVDYQHLQETGMVEQLNANHDHLQWNPQPDLDKGDWSVESPVAMVRHFKHELARSLKTRLGSLQDADDDASTSENASSI